jgi:hypothetical protein
MPYIIITIHILAILPLQILVNRFYNARIIKKRGALTTTQPIAFKSFTSSLMICTSSLGVLFCFHMISLGWLIWILIIIFGIGNTWVSMLFISESARRYMITNMVDQNPQLRPEVIVSKYNKFHIIDLRIKRILEWKCAILENDYYKACPGLMLNCSKLIRWWAKILGFKWAKDFS